MGRREDQELPTANKATSMIENLSLAMLTVDPREENEEVIQTMLTSRLASQRLIEEIQREHFSSCTDLVRLQNIPKHYGISCELWAKCEFQNLSGSSKYRVALVMLEVLERRGMIRPFESTIITHTSATFSFALALANIRTGRRFEIVTVLPDRASHTKINLLYHMNIKIFRAAEESSDNRISKDSPYSMAQFLCSKVSNAYLLDPFQDALSMETHLWWTGQELKTQLLDKTIDLTVCGYETGGMISGLSPVLKSLRKDNGARSLVIGADLSGRINKEKISKDNEDGLVEEYSSRNVTNVLSLTAVDKWYTVPLKEAFSKARELLLMEGIPASPSAGAVLHATLEAIKDLQLGADSDKKVVLILDNSVYHTDFEFASNDWMIRRNFWTPDDVEAAVWFHKMYTWRIPVRVPVTVLSSFNAHAVYSMMLSEKVPRVVVYDVSSQSILGIATVQLLLAGIEKGLVTSITIVGNEHCISTSFRTIHINESISTLLELFKTHSYAVLVQRQRLASRVKPEEQTWVAGILEIEEVIGFLVDLEQKHSKKFGAVLAGGFQSVSICKPLPVVATQSSSEASDKNDNQGGSIKIPKTDLDDLAGSIAPNFTVQIVMNSTVEVTGVKDEASDKIQSNNEPQSDQSSSSSNAHTPSSSSSAPTTNTNPIQQDAQGSNTSNSPPPQQAADNPRAQVEGAGNLGQSFSMPFTPSESDNFKGPQSPVKAPPPSEVFMTAEELSMARVGSNPHVSRESSIRLNSAESSSIIHLDSSEPNSSNDSENDLQSEFSALSISESIFRAMFTTESGQRNLIGEINSNVFISTDSSDAVSHSSSSNFIQSPNPYFAVPIFHETESPTEECTALSMDTIPNAAPGPETTATIHTTPLANPLAAAPGEQSNEGQGSNTQTQDIPQSKAEVGNNSAPITATSPFTRDKVEHSRSPAPPENSSNSKEPKGPESKEPKNK